METSAYHQKQKRTLSKPHRIAQSIVGQFTSLSDSPLKRVSLIGIGVLTGVGVPAIVFATQQQAVPLKAQSTTSSTVTIQNTAPSDNEGASTSTSSAASSVKIHSAENSPDNTSVTINGEEIATGNGTVSRQIINDDGSQVNVDVSIDNNTTTANTSGSSTNSTHIYVNSSSSSSTDGQNSVRGSPRR